MNPKYLRPLTLTGLAFYAAFCAAAGGGLTPVQIYNRCYSQIVRSHPPAGDPLLQKIKNAELTAPAACMALIDRAGLSGAGKVNADDPVARDVLKTFQALHSSWFPNHDFNVFERDWVTSNIYDTNEMGYHLTSALLGGRRFSEITTSAESFRGLRASASPTPFLTETDPNGKIQKAADHNWMHDDETPRPFQPFRVEFGELLGIGRQPTGANVIRKSDGTRGVIELDLNETLGGGILGTPSYILLSSTLPPKIAVDDQRKVHRAWSKAIFSDLLCRTLPVINPGDATASVQASSTIPFRRQESCMQCHASTDPMAALLRRVDFNWTTAKTTDDYVVRAIVRHGPDLRAPSSDTQARLYFRDYRGRLVNQPVHDVAELGKNLSGLDDLYLCFTKRYFEFFTGIDVTLRDFTGTSPDKYRDFIIQTGLEFKAHQSSKKLIEAIFKSEFYSRRDYGWTP